MEGNDCYKFSTIRNFIEATGAEPVRVMMDIGVNVGLVTQLMKQYFPEASVYGFEPVPEYFEMARYNTAGCAGVHLYPRPVTSRHLYADDLAAQRYAAPPALRVWKALPEAGPGWSPLRAPRFPAGPPACERSTRRGRGPR